MRITHLSSKSATNDDEIVNYLNIISSKVAEQIESKFLSTEERKRYGHSPTS